MMRAVMGGSDLYLGVNETDQNTDAIFVYPNPVSDVIHFKLSDPSAFKKLALYDVMGRTVLTEKITNHSDLDVKNIPNGFYIIKFFDDEHQRFISKKILLNH